MDKDIKTFQFRTQGTCCQLIQVSIQGDKVVSAEFFGGCNGNLKGIANLIQNMSIDDVITKLTGIKCGAKPTSCPDQLAQALMLYKNSAQKASV